VIYGGIIMPTLYRKRLIPNECILLKDDVILYNENNFIITKWKTIRPKKDLAFGLSLYDINNGFKISKFYNKEGKFICWYCDIIKTDYDEETAVYVFTDLLADVLIYEDGSVKVVDLDELAKANEDGLLSVEDMREALFKTNALLNVYSAGEFKEYTDMINEYDN